MPRLKRRPYPKSELDRLVSESFHRRGKRLQSQMTGMSRSPGQAADGPHQFLTPQLTGFGNASSLHQFGQQRSARHGRNASLSEKPNFLNTPVSNSHSKLQNIAAGGIFNLRRGVGTSHFAGVARVLEVIENLG